MRGAAARASIEFAAPEAPSPVSDRRKVLPQYVLPKRGLTAFAGRVASRERGATTTRLVRWFVRKYGVDLSEAVESDSGRVRELQRLLHPRAEAGRAAARATQI